MPSVVHSARVHLFDPPGVPTDHCNVVSLPPSWRVLSRCLYNILYEEVWRIFLGHRLYHSPNPILTCRVNNHGILASLRFHVGRKHNELMPLLPNCYSHALGLFLTAIVIVPYPIVLLLCSFVRYLYHAAPYTWFNLSLWSENRIKSLLLQLLNDLLHEEVLKMRV